MIIIGIYIYIYIHSVYIYIHIKQTQLPCCRLQSLATNETVNLLESTIYIYIVFSLTKGQCSKL